VESEGAVAKGGVTTKKPAGDSRAQVTRQSRAKARQQPSRAKKSPSCFLDMDGLLADLFDTVALRLHRKKYTDTSLGERAVTRDLWTRRDKFSGRVGDIEELFANLSPYPTNGELLDIVCERFGGFFICSHPARIDPGACIRGKLRWIQQHIAPKYGKYLKGIHFPSQKEDFATAGGIPNLLVDDYTPYVEAWRRTGGIGIRIRADRFPEGKGFREHFLRELDGCGI